MSRIVESALLVGTLVSFVACGVELSDTYEIEEGPNWSYSTFIGSIDEFPYEMSAERKSQVLEGYPSLEVGMTKEQVLEVLGPPDGEFLTYSQTQGGKLVELGWSYYLTRAESELAHPSDQVVSLHFAPDGLLYWAMGANIEGIESVGGPRVGDS